MVGVSVCSGSLDNCNSHDWNGSKIEQIYSPYVKIIHSPIQFNKNEAEEYFCDYVHKTLKGNILQAKIIKKQLFRLSKFLNE